MYIFCVDFSKNNLLAEQLNTKSLYDLPVMNKLLIEHQIVNFADLSIKKTFLFNYSKNIDLTLFDCISIDDKEIFKELALIDNNERFIAFRNDVFFETDNLTLCKSENGEMLYLKDENDNTFLVCGSIVQLKRLFNKNISFSDILKRPEKYGFTCYDLFEGYIKQLDNVKNYKSLLFDILNNKTSYKPPFIAEGVFTDSEVPKGDFSIIPPVFLGRTVQIESGSVIGPNTVIYNNILISENTSIKNSVLFDNVFVSSNCFIDGSVCCNNASIKRNTAVFSGSVIGADALIGEDMTLENDSLINKNVKYDKFNDYYFKKNNFFPFKNKFQGLLPDKAAFLGSAVAVVFGKPKIIVGCDGSLGSLSLKLAFLSGLIASGSECLDLGVTFKSQIFFSAAFCNCEYSVFFSGLGSGTDIEIFNSDNEKISETQCCNLFDYCKKGKFNLINSEELKNIRQIKGLRRMYIREISEFSQKNLPFLCHVFCDNRILLKTLDEILKICTNNDEVCDKFVIYMNESGTNVNIKFNDKLYSQKILKKLVFFFINDFNKAKIFESDLYRKFWRYDSVVLVVLVLNIISFTGKKLDTLIEETPSFYIKSDTVNSKLKDGDIAEKISSDYIFNHKNSCFNIKCKNGCVKLINDKEKARIKILASSNSMAISEELCALFKEFFS